MKVILKMLRYSVTIRDMKTTFSHDHVIGLVSSDSFGQIYEQVGNSLKKGYGILYAAEPIGGNNNEQRIMRRMEKKTNENIRRYAENELLTITDPDSMYYLAGINPQKLVELWRSYFSNAERKSGRKLKGIVAVYSPDSYFSRGHHELFLSFEQMIGRTFGKPVQLLCWYKKKWMTQLPLAFAIRILTSHQNTVRKGWNMEPLSKDRITKIVASGIDNELGEGASALLFNTMKARFGLNEDAIVSQPEAFEDTMSKMLGDGSTDHITTSILKEINDAIAFDFPGGGRSAGGAAGR
jgi:hypothetical protein